MLLVSLAVMRCLPINEVPEKYCEANFLGEGETNEAIFKGSARKPLSLAKFVWTRGCDITTAGNITCREANITPPRKNTGFELYQNRCSFLVDPKGFEPSTSALRTWGETACNTTGFGCLFSTNIALKRFGMRQHSFTVLPCLSTK